MRAVAKWSLIVIALSVPILDHFEIFQRLEWLSFNHNHFIMVLLAAIAAFSFTRADQLDQHIDNVQVAITESRNRIINAVEGVDALHYDDSEKAFAALEVLIRESKTTIDQVSIAKTPPLPRERLESYHNAIRKIAGERRVLYRYAYGDNWPERGQRLQRISEDRRFYLGELAVALSPTMPMLNFAIFDGEVVYMGCPNKRGAREDYIIVKNPVVARLFSSYFEAIWSSANKLNSEDQDSI